MSENEKIKIGDKVSVTLSIGQGMEQAFHGEVLQIPSINADVDIPDNIWIFKDENNRIRYVKYFIQIIKLIKT